MSKKKTNSRLNHIGVLKTRHAVLHNAKPYAKRRRIEKRALRVSEMRKLRMRRSRLLICLILSLLPFQAASVYGEQLPDVQGIIAPAAVAIDAKTGVVVYGKNMNDRHYPASITKIMTALLTVEYANTIPDGFSERVYFSASAVANLKNTSNIAMIEGDTLTIKEALYGLMLASANDVANALAEHIGTTNEGFALLMTRRAKELGAKDTNFTNPHGLPDENHYTTALDMALIMREAVKHPEFVEIIGTDHYDLPPTEMQPESRPLNNGNKMIVPTSSSYNSDVVGGKTGFTNDAMHTLVVYGKKDQDEIITAVMKNEKNFTYKDTKIMLDYSFSEMDDVKTFNKEIFKKTVEVFDSEGNSVGFVNAAASHDIHARIPKSAVSRIQILDDLPQKLEKSINAGDEIGEVMIYCDDVLIGESPITALNSVDVPIPVIALTNEDTEEEAEKTSIFSSAYSIVMSIKSAVIAVSALVALFIAKAFFAGARRRRRRTGRYRLYKAKKTAYRYKKRI